MRFAVALALTFLATYLLTPLFGEHYIRYWAGVCVFAAAWEAWALAWNKP